MAVTIGVFESPHEVAMAMLKMRKLGILEYNVALLALDRQDDRKGRPSVYVSGYLEHDAHKGEIRTIEEGVYLALSREDAYSEDMISWLPKLKAGNGVVIIRSRPDQAPWLAEALRRSGALIAVDSESQGELAEFARESKWADAARAR